MRTVIIVLGLIGAASALPRNSRIMGGESTPIERYPFMAGLLLEWEGVFYLNCGGTLITPTAVVSAAHCVDLIDNNMLRIKLGTNKAESGGSEHIVSQLIRHPEYSPILLTNDVVVIRLRNAVTYTDQIKNARIAGSRYILPDNTVVYAAGWGHTEFEGSMTEILQHVAVNTMNHHICTEHYAYLKTQPGYENWPEVTTEMMCTSDVGKGACYGDVGGPVVHNGDILVGISSWGFQCADSFYPGVNVRVSAYTSWINETSMLPIMYN